MTAHARKWSDVPQVPALYAMHGGEPPRTWAAYVGIAGGLQGRLIQHFIRRDSSVVTTSSAVGVNIDLVIFVDWWEHPLFVDETSRHAAELVAFRVIDPALRSRANVRRDALALAQDPDFVQQMEVLLRGEPTGRYWPPRLSAVAEDVALLREEVAVLRADLTALRGSMDSNA